MVFSRKLNITLFYRTFDISGVPHMMTLLANKLVDRGFNVDLIAGVVKHDFKDRLDKRVNFINMATPSIIALTLKLSQYIREKGPDNIFTAVPNSNMIAIFAKYIAFSKTNIIISERSDTIYEYKNSPWGLYKISILLSPIFYRLANHIVAVSQGTAESLSKFTKIKPDSINVIYNPAFEENITNLSHENLSHPWFVDDFKIVVSAGRLRPQKDYGTLIRAAALIKKTHPNFRFIILGDGPERNALQELSRELGVSDIVELPGQDQNPYRWFRRSDVFVLTSKWEGFGNVLVQALGCGCNVVATDVPSGPREILDNGRFGTLVASATPQTVADAIIERCNNPISSDILIARAKEFSMDAAIERYLELMVLYEQPTKAY